MLQTYLDELELDDMKRPPLIAYCIPCYRWLCLCIRVSYTNTHCRCVLASNWGGGSWFAAHVSQPLAWSGTMWIWVTTWHAVCPANSSIFAVLSLSLQSLYSLHSSQSQNTQNHTSYTEHQSNIPHKIARRDSQNCSKPEPLSNATWLGYS